jgi:hypothetical protein
MPGGAAPWGAFVYEAAFIAGDTGGRIVGMHVDFFSVEKRACLALDGEPAPDARDGARGRRALRSM